MIEQGKVRLIRRRETMQDLLAPEILRAGSVVVG
jgi:hypothetical protein